MANQQQQQNKPQKQGEMRGTLPASELEAQNKYWRDNYQNEPYYTQGQRFEAYEPAYKLGIEARNEHPQQGFAEVENQLRAQYENGKQAQKLEWAQAKQAVRAAWDHAEQAMGMRH